MIIIEATDDQIEILKRVVTHYFPNVVIRDSHSDHQDVRNFNTKFHLPIGNYPMLLDQKTFDFRVNFLKEEVQEMEDAYAAGSLHEVADALIDLSYVTHGTAIMMGIPWSPLWKEVHRANMDKVRVTSADQSKRGSSLDCYKPVGWTAPNFTPWLGEK